MLLAANGQFSLEPLSGEKSLTSVSILAPCVKDIEGQDARDAGTTSSLWSHFPFTGPILRNKRPSDRREVTSKDLVFCLSGQAL